MDRTVQKCLLLWHNRIAACLSLRSFMYHFALQKLQIESQISGFFIRVQIQALSTKITAAFLVLEIFKTLGKYWIFQTSFFRETPLINSSSYFSYSWWLLLYRCTLNFWKIRIKSSLKDPRQKYRQQKIFYHHRSRIWWVHLIFLLPQSDCPLGWFSFWFSFTLTYTCIFYLRSVHIYYFKLNDSGEP